MAMLNLKAPPLMGEIHIWRCPISVARTLSPEVQEPPSSSISSVKRRLEFMAGRKLLYFLLEAYLGEERASEVEILSSAKGKPYLSTSGLHFSLSHSEGWVAVALSSVGPMGLDLERIRPLKVEQLVRRVLNRGEQEEMEALPLVGREREDYFFWRWTCKEATAKLSGEGLSGSQASSDQVVVSCYEQGFYLSLAHWASSPVERVRWLCLN